MVRQNGRKRLGIAAMIGTLGFAAWPVQAQAPEMRMLDNLSKGSWNLRIRDDGTNRSVCLRDGRELIQLQHRDRGCSRFVVDDSANAVTVQYTCRGNGYGRTTIRRESNELVQVQTQGIHNGTPFSYSAEGRYAGGC